MKDIIFEISRAM